MDSHPQEDASRDKMKDDPRIDPRIKALLGNLPAVSFSDVENRQQALDEANTPAATAQRKQMEAMFDLIDNERVAPSAGLEISPGSSAPVPMAIPSKCSSSGQPHRIPCPVCITSTAAVCRA